MSEMLGSMLDLEVRVTLILGAGLILALAALRRSPAARVRVVAASALLALVAPLAGSVLPAWTLPATPTAVADMPELALPMEDAMAGLRRADLDASRPAPLRNASLAPFALAAWALGTAVLLTRLAAGIGRARALVAGSRPLDDALELRVACSSRVRLSDRVSGPVTSGLVRPVVLLPTCAAAWRDVRLAGALGHELDHVVRRDGLLHVVTATAAALHWWNPLAWACVRLLRVSRERAADDAAVRAGVRPTDLAEQLVASACEARRCGGLVLAMGDRTDLRSRVERLVAADFRPSAADGATPVVAALALVVVAMPVATAHRDAASRHQVAAEAQALGAPVAGQESEATRGARAGVQVLNDAGVARGLVLIVDGATGDVEARAATEGADVEALLADDRPKGSVIKPLLVAVALENGVVTSDGKLDGAGGTLRIDGAIIRDVEPTSELSVSDVLVTSSNVGAARIASKLGAERLRAGLSRYGIEGVPAGKWSDEQTARVGIGTAVAATPLELARAYARLTGSESASTARSREAVLEMLESVTLRGTGRRAAIDGRRVAGKTGTMSLPGGGTLATFVGLSSMPRKGAAPPHVVVVVAECRGQGYAGGTIAAPAFAAAVAELGAR